MQHIYIQAFTYYYILSQAGLNQVCDYLLLITHISEVIDTFEYESYRSVRSIVGIFIFNLYLLTWALVHVGLCRGVGASGVLCLVFGVNFCFVMLWQEYL